MANTVMSIPIGPIIAHGDEYGIKIPSNATVVSVKRDGVPIAYILGGRPGNRSVSEPPNGSGWKNGTIQIEYSIP